ncbi:MAG: helix-turn-helix domain-containing protein [Chloroflexota bacterium]|nr:helix-turn-helix domain-containing protein [Chloroflexota bacterium]
MAHGAAPPNIPVCRHTYSVPEFSAIFGVPLRTAYAAVQRGQIRSIKIGSRVVVPASEVERLLASSAPTARPAQPEPEGGDGGAV